MPFDFRVRQITVARCKRNSLELVYTIQRNSSNSTLNSFGLHSKSHGQKEEKERRGSGHILLLLRQDFC